MISREDFNALLDSIPTQSAGAAIDVRPPLQFKYCGKLYGLSIQASAAHYSQPRQGGLQLSAYEAVEMAMFKFEDDGAWVKGDHFGMPESLCAAWSSSDDIAPYVPMDTIYKIVCFLVSTTRSLPEPFKE